jgi:hypothetical protein
MAYDLERILPALNQGDAAARLSAAYALEQALKEQLEAGRIDWAPLVEQLLPVLVQGIGDRHKGVQVHSANCLEFLAYQSEAVIPALRVAMAGPDAWRAWGAALVTARMGYWFPEMGPALSGAMSAPDRDVRWASAGFTLQLGRNHQQAVTMVEQTLEAGSPLARKMAAYCLGAMGQYAGVEPALAARLGDPDRDVRRAVILAIDKLPAVSEPVKDQIAALRQDPDEFIRRTASAVAAKLGRP